MIVECASCRAYVEAAEPGAFEYVRHGGLWILFQSPNVVAVLQVHQIVAQTAKHLCVAEVSLFPQVLPDRIEHGSEGAEVVVCLDMEFE